MTDRTTLGVVAHAAGDLRVEQVPVPEPRPDEAEIAVAYGGVCGSDLHYWKHGAAGESILKAPMLLGHEIVGHVIRPAADGSGPAAGTPVAVHPGTPRVGASRHPADRPNLSSAGTYLGSAAHVPHTEGAFAAVKVLPTRMLRTIPDGLDIRAAAIAEPAAVAWHAVSRAGDVTGRRALVVGCGPIGALVVAVLARAGAKHITAVDVHPFPREIAASVGADTTQDASDTDAIAATDADVVIEASGNRFGLESAIRGTARGGRVVLLGLLPTGLQPAPLSLVITRELDLVGSFRFNDEIDDVLGAMAAGSLDAGAVITHTFPVTSALDAFAVAADSASSGKVLLSF